MQLEEIEQLATAPLLSNESEKSIDGTTILNDLHRYLGRFVAYPSSHTQVAHTLWIAHTHFMEKWDSTPRLAFLSVEPGSGKTRALEVTEPTVPRAVEAVNATPAYLIRKISSPDGLPTILFDEIDTVFGPKAKENEELRGVLNAGHRRGAVAGRCVIRGKTVETEELPSFCAVAVAGLGNLPDTILTRSVVIKMRKRAPGEKVKPWRRKLHAQEGRQLHDRLAAWAQAIAPLVPENPTMPEGISDRPADVWEALLAVAEAAGGDWPRRARVSCVSLVSHSGDEEASLGVTLLSDLRAILGAREAMFTDDLLMALIARDEAPWGDLRGKPLNARGLANLLKGYGIKSKQVRCGSATAKGYSRESFHDAFMRYLPPLANPMPAESETRETSETTHLQSNERSKAWNSAGADQNQEIEPEEVDLYGD
ncbi:MAG: DUF3631 domain-containing protein [Nitrospira sp.]|jgi:hypothetical protein|nr:DUF3631 domain-containing protein [Nitrospira sp.]MBL8054351.1 DUF3631 domain-containing protein [Nitrospira sp.]